ncbi:hypothetical protein ACQQ2N_18130 [Dokdonella sp. MW10]|uniref:hypothetical protein n=1 Tax=Dokdonella sp. MW10 TaxID=2992926 RepID=UPI003F7FB116
MARPPKQIDPLPATSYHAPRKSHERVTPITRERIASDLAAFREAGGHIEVLGITRVVTEVGADGKVVFKPSHRPGVTAPGKASPGTRRTPSSDR